MLASRALSTSRRIGVVAHRHLSTSTREVELLQQVSRLEARVAEVESMLPPRVKPERITDWENLAFGILPTNGHVRHTWSSVTQSWDHGQFVSDPYINMHIHAGVLHYGMTLFEGCKAFRCRDGKVRVCNLNENSARMNTGAARLVMPSVPQKMFNDAVDWAVRNNAEFVPPYGTGGSMYIRPFLMGTGPILGLQPCPEFAFSVSVTPVGNYFGKGGVTGVKACVSYARAPHLHAPHALASTHCTQRASTCAAPPRAAPLLLPTSSLTHPRLSRSLHLSLSLRTGVNTTAPLRAAPATSRRAATTRLTCCR